MANRLGARAINRINDKRSELAALEAAVKLAATRPDIVKPSEIPNLQANIFILQSERPQMKLWLEIVKGHIALLQRDFERAKKIYNEVLKADQGNPGAHFGLAWVYRLTNKIDKAIDEYKAGLKRQPNNYGALISLGDLYLGKMKWTLAEEYYKKALNVVPGDINARKGYALTLKAQGKDKEALKILDLLIQQAPKDPDPYTWKGMILAKHKKWADMIATLQQAVRLGAGIDAKALIARGFIELKKYGQALSVLKDALRSRPADLQLNYLAAITLERTGNYAQALRLYKSLLSTINHAPLRIAKSLADVKMSCERAISRITQILKAKELNQQGKIKKKK